MTARTMSAKLAATSHKYNRPSCWWSLKALCGRQMDWMHMEVKTLSLIPCWISYLKVKINKSSWVLAVWFAQFDTYKKLVLILYKNNVLWFHELSEFVLTNQYWALLCDLPQWKSLERRVVNHPIKRIKEVRAREKSDIIFSLFT